MSYQSAKRNYETEKFEVNIDPVHRCQSCQLATSREEMGTYGCRCAKCFDAYCKAAPRYEMHKDYPNDAKGWAKRIIDKQKRGDSVGIYAAKLARDALGIKNDL